MNKKVITIVAAALVLVLGTGAYYLTRGGNEADRILSAEARTYDRIEFDVAPIDDFEVLDFGQIDMGFELPTFGGLEFGSIMPDVSVSLSAPSAATLNADIGNLEFGAPTAQQQQQQAPPAQQGPSVNASTCSQFSGVPSCSYVGAGQARQMCEACKAAGF